MRRFAPGPWIETLLLSGLFALVAASRVLVDEGVFSIDAFYHFRLVRTMVEQGPVVDVPWLPLTVLGADGPDHHWLWHLLLVPFAWVGDPESGMRLAIVANATAVPLVFHLTGRGLGVRWMPMWTLLLFAGGTSFLARLLMLRAQNAAIVLLLLYLWALARGSWRWSALVAFVFLQAYHGAVILLAPLVVHLATVAIGERRLDWRTAAATALGLGSALLLNPWFPRNVEYLAFHTLRKVGNLERLEVGPEWWTTPWSMLATEAWLAHLLLVAALVAAVLRARTEPQDRMTSVLIGSALVAFGLYRYAHRFAEYYVPLATLAAAYALAPSLGSLRPNVRTAVIAALVVVGIGRGVQALEVYDGRTKSRFDIHRTLVATLEREAEPDALVFNARWDDFPYLVWHSPRFRYVAGLDPHYLAAADPERFRIWREVGEGRSADPVTAVLGLGSRWVLMRPTERALFEQLRADPRARLAAISDWGALFELRGSQGG